MDGFIYRNKYLTNDPSCFFYLEALPLFGDCCIFKVQVKRSSAETDYRMSVAIDFQRVLYNWDGKDGAAKLHQLLKDNFPQMTEAQKKEIEPVIINMIKYISDNEKYLVALRFLQDSNESSTPVAASKAAPIHNGASAAIAKPLHNRTSPYRDGLDRDSHNDAIEHYKELESFSHKDASKFKRSGFERKLGCGIALNYYTESLGVGRTPEQLQLILSVLHLLLCQRETAGLSLARGVSNIHGTPSSHIKLHEGTHILENFFADGKTIPILAKDPQIAQMAKHFKTDLDCLKGLSQLALIDLIRDAKHHTRSGIIVPVYGIGFDCEGKQVFFTRVALQFADGIFKRRMPGVLPFQEKIYEELCLKYRLIKDAKGNVGAAFNDPKFCGKYDHYEPTGNEWLRWKYMPNQGRPLKP